MAQEAVAGELERFLAERAGRLMRTAVLLTGSRDAGQDLPTKPTAAAVATQTMTWSARLRWLPPTAGNIARTLITIPPGFIQVHSADDM